jgi:hypothetical protein
MIHTRVSKHCINVNPDLESIAEIHISITEDSLPNFIALVNRALNCWDTAPKELKDLGDMITHGRVTQDHEYKNVGAAYTHGGSYTPTEIVAFNDVCADVGEIAFRQLLMGDRVELHKLMKLKLK